MWSMARKMGVMNKSVTAERDTALVPKKTRVDWGACSLTIQHSQFSISINYKAYLLYLLRTNLLKSNNNLKVKQASWFVFTKYKFVFTEYKLHKLTSKKHLKHCTLLVMGSLS
jgi:hypothetical protein